MDDRDALELVRQLVNRIETATFSLHRGGSYLTRCKRVTYGLDDTGPEDCTCGLDVLLAEARALTGNPPSEREPPLRHRDKSKSRRLTKGPANGVDTWGSLDG